jgi:hypothetical protein
MRTRHDTCTVQVDKAMFDRLNKAEHREDAYCAAIRQMLHTYTTLLSDPHFQIKGLYVVEDYEDAPSLRQMLKADGLMTTKQKKVGTPQRAMWVQPAHPTAHCCVQPSRFTIPSAQPIPTVG